MGQDKATLPFGPETLLQRIVRLVSQVIDTGRIVVVSAADQALPALPDEVLFAHDRVPGRGPLEGLAAGLRALGDTADAAYVTSCDAPFLAPAFLARMFDLLQGFEAVVPCDGERLHPLAAVYRVGVLPHVDALLSQDLWRIRLIYDRVATRCADVASLRDVDPELRSLQNLNHPDDYRAALKLAGFQPPQDLT